MEDAKVLSSGWKSFESRISLMYLHPHLGLALTIVSENIPGIFLFATKINIVWWPSGRPDKQKKNAELLNWPMICYLYYAVNQNRLFLFFFFFIIIIIIIITLWGILPGVMVKGLNCGFEVSEFEPQSRYFVYFRTITFGKVKKFFIPTVMS